MELPEEQFPPGASSDSFEGRDQPQMLEISRAEWDREQEKLSKARHVLMHIRLLILKGKIYGLTDKLYDEVVTALSAIDAKLVDDKPEQSPFWDFMDGEGFPP